MLAIAVSVLAGCSSDDDGTLEELPRDPEATTTSPSEVTTTTGPAASDEAELTKLAYDWYEVSKRVLADPNPDDPRLFNFLTGELLAVAQRNMASRRDKSLQTRPASQSQARYEVTSVEVEGDEASLTACWIDDDVLFSSLTDEVVNDEVLTYEASTTAMRTEEGWKFSKESYDRSTGVSGCAAGW